MPSQQTATSTAAAVQAESDQPPIRSLHFVDAQTGWAVTYDPGRLLRTADGGQTWYDVTPDEIWVWSVSALDANCAWIVESDFDPAGMKDIVYRTADGGDSWQTYQSTFKQGAVYMQDVLNGWVIEQPYGCGAGSCWVGVYTTADGGETWQQLPLSDQAGDGVAAFPGLLTLISSRGLWLSDPNTIWLHGDFTLNLLHGQNAILTVSRDAGRTWEELVVPMPDSAPGKGIPHYVSRPTFFNSKVGYFSAHYAIPTKTDEPRSGYIAFFNTQDGGHHWQALPSVVEVDPYHVIVEYISQQKFILLCGQRLCASKDGGQNWDVLESSLDAELKAGAAVIDIDFVNIQRGWAVLLREETGFQLYRTVDGGSIWELVGK